MKINDTFLVMSSLPEFCDNSKPCVYLGEWCLSWEEKISKNFHGKAIFSDSLVNKINSIHGFNYTIKIYEALLPKLSQWLNTVHHLQYSLRYWRIIIGPFLLLYIQTVYHRFMLLKKAHTAYSNLNTIGLTSSSFVTPDDTDDFLYLAGHSDGWNHQLLTQLWNLTFQPISRNRDYFWDPELKQRHANAQEITRYKIRTKIQIHLIKLLIKITGKRVTGLHNTDIIFCGKWNLLKIFLLSKLKALPLFEVLPKQILSHKKKAISKVIRNELGSIEVKGSFSKLILETLKINLPLNFLESYQNANEESQRCFPYKLNTVFTLSLIENDKMKFWAARQVEAGGKLVTMQHGGCYGHYSFSTYENIERENTDAFISWGWSDNGKKIIPSPGVFISKLIEENRKNPRSEECHLILWSVTEPTSRYLTYFSAFPVTTTMYPYLKWQERFLAAVKTDVLNEILFRPRQTRQWHHYIVSRWKTLKIDTENEKEAFFNRLKNTKILVVDNLNTTFLYGLALNIPTILFWEKNSYPIRKEAKPFFELLQNAKIYHDSPESAATLLNNVAENPASWWSNRVVQNAREKFCDTYIKTSDHALREWAKILITIQT
ncbi:MAG: hypothetical protein A3E54_05095 [Gammaproteobacteria bacterium RIFCSPHIGHO2_12_FULL_41_25]|nr:MAG: hypothetical protein A3B71_05330 [Gammaproteobacteria bacterium RIFCSPHIGHO2_02_FULL_42_43]OGT27534.1 MAG: hypothetical protein A2624_03780 [Gammaproteobacteria bacterium RIFCSPHIGHO2_01_FULL_42_8]OGT51418.1 MAG: hypothetical protein A3E54_05095 [Gammaproteobacteria bacterium RIFCSPHIGHO2_12_FULL_41_25]OGT85792.1 MAG: hypothetical protein A3G86_03720 [Gammaproteobacteria bacterium RIFCSPLOWO2_12_FULL_42_18]